MPPSFLKVLPVYLYAISVPHDFGLFRQTKNALIPVFLPANDWFTDMKYFSISSSAIQFPITYSPLHTQSPCYLVKTLIKSLTVTWHGNCMINHL